ncbi:hypothetical protein BDW71DRAFT_198801 [Aspergillus fruticulosus]
MGTCPLIWDPDDDAKPHVCHFCGAQYKRSEARRRRWNAGTEIPKRSLSGKRKQACDLCTARKRACSTGSPCSECEMRKAECTYHRLRPSARLRESLDSAEQTPPESTAAGTAAQDRSTSTHGPLFRFLARFTKANGLNEAYSYKVQSTTVNPSSSQLKEDGGADWDGLLGTTVSNPFDCYLDEFESCLWSYTDTARGHIGEAFLQCILDVHKATFGLNTCSHLLLITMCLIGACMPARETDHQSANRFLDTQENIQILQATCFMCLLQKWEGSVQGFTAFVAWPLLTADNHNLQPRLPLDSTFVIFHNSVPRMVLQEMTIDLTCPEDAFQAASPAEFTSALKLHPPCTAPLLTDCVRNCVQKFRIQT